MTRLAKNVVYSLPLVVLHAGDHEIEKPHRLIEPGLCGCSYLAQRPALPLVQLGE